MSSLFLAQVDASIFVWMIVLIIVVVGLFGLVVWLRRRLSPDEDFHGEGFTLGDLRRLHQSGQLSTEEFERAKAQLVASAQAAQARQSGERNSLREVRIDPTSRH